MCFKRKMTRVEETNFSIRIIASERFCSSRQKERIILAPDRQQGWMIFAEKRLKLRIEGNIAGVVKEEVKLDFIVSRSGEQNRIECVALGRNERLVGDAVGVLPPRRFRLEKVAQCFAVCAARVFPITLDWIPTLAEPFLVSVSILGDDGGHPFGVS